MNNGRVDLELSECGYCHCNPVTLVWKQYLKQYRGMCPNEACQIWSVVTEIKPNKTLHSNGSGGNN